MSLKGLGVIEQKLEESFGQRAVCSFLLVVGTRIARSWKRRWKARSAL